MLFFHHHCNGLLSITAEGTITEEEDTEETNSEDEHTGPVGDGLVTLSQLPKSRWHTLAHIDAIKVLHCITVLSCVISFTRNVTNPKSHQKYPKQLPSSYPHSQDCN